MKKIEEYWQPKINEINQKKSHCIGSKKGQRKSRRWKWYNKKLQYLHRKRSGQLHLYYHKLANQILQNTKANTIIIGNLNFKKMAKKKKGTGNTHQNKINKTINRRLMSGISKFTQFLEYKAQKMGKKIIKIDEKNTTKRCCRCNTLKKMKLYDREYICNECGNHMNRDENSAVNIMKEFLLNKKKYGFPITQPSLAEELFLKQFSTINSHQICLPANAERIRRDVSKNKPYNSVITN